MKTFFTWFITRYDFIIYWAICLLISGAVIISYFKDFWIDKGDWYILTLPVAIIVSLGINTAKVYKKHNA